MSTHWVVGPDHIVHHAYCAKVGRKNIRPYVSLPKDNEAMLAWLKRRDTKDGHTELPALKPCPLCLPEPE